MAFNATAVGEIRSSGNASNGGFYDSSYGGTDYSQQDAAQLTLTDAVCASTSTTLTSATGGFTTAMVGNAIQVASGTTCVLGFYMITARTDTNTITLDRTCTTGGNNASSMTIKVGGASTIAPTCGATAKTDYLFDGPHMTQGMKYWIGPGTHTIDAAVSLSINGIITAPYNNEGYNTTRGDTPLGDNRPTIALAANSCTLDNFRNFRNIIFTTTQASGILTGTYNEFYNCKVYNSSTTANRTALSGYSYCRPYNCELISTNGTAYYLNQTNNSLVNCYLHDSKNGISGGSSGYAQIVIGNIIEACSSNGYNITSTSNAFLYIINNTIDTCVSGITGGNNAVIALNNIISNNSTIGATWTTAQPLSIWDGNNWYNNGGSDVTNIAKGANDTANAPSFTGANDFSLQSSSLCKGEGIGILYALTGGSSLNSTPDQGAIQSAPGGATAITRVWVS